MQWVQSVRLVQSVLAGTLGIVGTVVRSVASASQDIAFDILTINGIFAIINRVGKTTKYMYQKNEHVMIAGYVLLVINRIWQSQSRFGSVQHGSFFLLLLVGIVIT